MKRWLRRGAVHPPRPSVRRWPLFLLALPAAVATWSGWVGLGRMVGFGVVHPLPGIADDLTIDTAITLPIGVEAYAVYALSAWLSATDLAPSTRAFAQWSAIGALALGMAGQVAYHLLVVFGYTTAPWQVVTVVSCLPVLVLGMGATLGHLIGRDVRAAAAALAVDQPLAEVHPDPPAEPSGTPGAEDPTEAHDEDHDPVDEPTKPQATGVPGADAGVPEPTDLQLQAANAFFFDLAGGTVPGVRRIKAQLGIGQEKAQDIRAYLARLAAK